ncbi:LexA family transcriptional regulator, partial [Acinetobacter baumannii]
MATLGENLKAIRKAKKMTQKELAMKSGVKQSVISDLETG